MIFAKFVFSIKVRKLLNFAFVSRSQNEENPLTIRIQKRVVLKHRIWRVFPWISGAFWSPKVAKTSQIFEKNDIRRRPLQHYRFRVAFWMDFQPLGAWFWMIFEPPEPFFDSRIAFEETFVKRFRLKNLLWWLGRRLADQSIDPLHDRSIQIVRSIDRCLLISIDRIDIDGSIDR